MKKILNHAALLALFIHPIIFFAQSGWLWQNPLPQGNYLNSVSYVNSSVVYVSGALGTLLKSTNGGLNFTVVPTGLREDLGVYFINELTGFSPFWTGLLRTTSGGSSWQFYQVPTDYEPLQILFVPNSGIFLLKRKYVEYSNSTYIYKSTDLGETWSISLIPSPNTEVNTFHFVDQNTGYAVGRKRPLTYSKIYKTINGGTNWDSVASNIHSDLRAVYFTNPNTGYVATYTFLNKILKTTNGCISWDTVYHFQTSPSIHSIRFFDELNGYLAEYDNIIKTTNAGMNWEEISTNRLTYLNDINNGLGLGSYYGSNFVHRTTNSGVNWTQITQGFGLDLWGVTFINENTGFTVGYNRIYKTINSGNNWTEYNLNLQNSPYLENIMFVNDNTGYAGIDGGRIAKTTNCGANWQVYETGCYDHNHGMSFPSADTGYAVTKYGFYLKTTNGGVNWINFGQITGHGFGHVFFIDNNTGFAGGANNSIGMVRITNNGGLNWTTVMFDSVHFFYDVCAASANIWFACGTAMNNPEGIIARSTNGGLSWTYVVYPQIVTAIYFPSSLVGYASTYGGIMYKTINGGDSWVATECINANPSYGIYFVNQNTGWAVGLSGQIIKATTGGGDPIGIQPVSIEAPKGFLLHQNYPNPFNPVTKIKFALPPSPSGEGLGVGLIIYDILGREITTLVNEQLNPGVYEVEWDGTNYPSGVYFYRLSAQDYSETRKMVLLK